MRLIVAITGASGAIYGKRLIEALKERGVEVHLIVSESARFVVEHELDDPRILEGMADRVYDPRNLSAPVTSGSFRVDGMVIVPASMKTVAAIASGYCENLVARAADVQLKERRPLIVVPRETPLNAIHLENMAKLSRRGVTILPAMPGFYHRPETIGDLVDFVVGKILDQLGLDHDLYRRWAEATGGA
ncbi:aromatic acid decarboxylase [Candidatus Bathyarchaeota archaeon]|nr:MAG: aromatic acid decarboxylase [Candidatus Bathyarchaeota archaeon]